MNTKKIILVSTLIFSIFTFSSFKAGVGLNDATALIQNGLLVYATYDGHEDYGYNFVTTDKEGEEHTLTFQKVDDGVLATFDLNSEVLIGSKFKITFNKKIKVTKDADGYEDEEEINTITSLEQL